MNIGSLYRVKKHSWLLFSLKKTAVTAVRQYYRPAAAIDWPADVAEDEAEWYSKEYNENVTWFAPESYVVLLEEDGKFKRVLIKDGVIGWIWFDKGYNDCFEEVKTE